MEKLIDQADCVSIQRIAYSSASQFNKKQFNRAIQELYLTDQKLNLSAATIANMTKVLDFCAQKLST
jgi:hypothetical protein